MRVVVTGGSGFVGTNVVRVFAERHGAEVVAPSHASVDLTDRASVLGCVAEVRPDAVVHCAILNDLGRLYADRRGAWDSYVGATGNVVDAANAVQAKVVLVSTDWVFDGTQSGADERTPPNPVNLYGVLKMASELVVGALAEDGAVARISGVNGVHWARPAAPRSQDAGFGYFVVSLVETLSAGRPFTVWLGEDGHQDVNMIATPSLASQCAEMMWRIVDRDLQGTFHCCGGEAVGRWRLAELAADVFELDATLLRAGRPDVGWADTAVRVPYDTSLDATATAAALDMDLPSARELLAGLRHELDTGSLAAVAASRADGPGMNGQR
jgi:dTDP-4-dehydrorhamnose reductase